MLCALPECDTNVGEENEHVDDNKIIKRSRNLQKLAALPDIQVIAHDGRHTDEEQRNQLQIRKLRPFEFPVRLFGNDVVGGAHESGEQPDDQQIRMHRTCGIEGYPLMQPIHTDAGKAHDETIDDLQSEQQHR